MADEPILDPFQNFRRFAIARTRFSISVSLATRVLDTSQDIVEHGKVEWEPDEALHFTLIDDPDDVKQDDEVKDTEDEWSHAPVPDPTLGGERNYRRSRGHGKKPNGKDPDTVDPNDRVEEVSFQSPKADTASVKATAAGHEWGEFNIGMIYDTMEFADFETFKIDGYWKNVHTEQMYQGVIFWWMTSPTLDTYVIANETLTMNRLVFPFYDLNPHTAEEDGAQFQSLEWETKTVYEHLPILTVARIWDVGGIQRGAGEVDLINVKLTPYDLTPKLWKAPFTPFSETSLGWHASMKEGENEDREDGWDKIFEIKSKGDGDRDPPKDLKFKTKKIQVTAGKQKVWFTVFWPIEDAGRDASHLDWVNDDGSTTSEREHYVIVKATINGIEIYPPDKEFLYGDKPS